MLDKLQKAFNRFDDTTAIFVEKVDYDDYEGTYNTIQKGSVKGDLQPYSGGLLEKDYGLQKECQKRFFCLPNEHIKEGAYLKVGVQHYQVTYIADRKIRWEVMLKEVELND